MGKFFQYSFGKKDITEGRNILWRALCAEFVGIFLLNFFSCGACTQGDTHSIAIAFGFSVFVAISIIGHISGGHINPAVTLAILVTGRISLLKAVLYVVVQCVGAVAGTATLKVLLNEKYHQGLGNTQLAEGVTPLQGLGFEFFLGFVLVLTVFGVCDVFKPDSRFLAPLSIGLAVALGHLGTIKYTGSSMNPARSFGTAVVTGVWDDHWIYWLGPILGGIFAALIYVLIFEVGNSNNDLNQGDEREMEKLRGEFA